jgi:hypothetical protein
MDAQHFVKNLLDIAVRQRALRTQRFARTRPRFELLPDALPFGVGLWAKNR